MPERVLIVFHLRILRIALNRLGARRRVKAPGPAYSAYEAKYADSEVLVVLSFPGAPLAVGLVDALSCCGARRMVAVGWAGSINPRLRVGDLVAPSWALREEGASFHYMPDPSYTPKPSEPLASALYEELLRRAKGRRVSRGGIWSIDAPYRETLDKVVKYHNLGVDAVDMEASALMTVADYRGVDLAVAVAISDELRHDGTWINGYMSRRLSNATRIAVEASLNVLATI